MIAGFTFVLKIISMVSSSKLEKLLYTKEKILMTQIFQVLLISIPISLLIAQLLEHFTPISKSEINNESTILLIYLAVGYFFSVFFVLPIYFGIFSDFLGKSSYYIEHEIHGKMYIVKAMNKKELMLFENRRLYINNNSPKTVIIARDELKEYPILLEIQTSNFVQDFKLAWNKIKVKLRRA